jgi:vacuolar protein sorting-associated protein 13A/C
VDGVSGVILKPISGAKQEGVEGFFKGVGKGVMGLVARPTAGVIDFASGSFDAVKRYALPAFCVMLLHLVPLKMQYQGSEM